MSYTDEALPRRQGRRGRPTVQEAISKNQISSGGAALLLGVSDFMVRSALARGDIKLVDYNIARSSDEAEKKREYRFDINSIAIYAIRLFKEEGRPITQELKWAATHCRYEVKQSLRDASTDTTTRHLAGLLVCSGCDALTGVLAYLAMPFKKFRDRIARSKVLNAMYEADELNDSKRKSYANPDNLIIEEITRRGFYMDYLTIRADERDTQRTALVIPSDHPIFGTMCVLVGYILADLKDDQELAANFLSLAARHGYVPYDRPKTESEKMLDFHFTTAAEPKSTKDTRINDAVEELRSSIG